MRLAGSLRGPASLLMSVSPKLSWIVSTAPQTSLREPPAGGSTVSVRQLENLNRLFSRYRISALGLSSIGLAALGLSVLALYGVKEGWRIFAVPAGACLVTFGALGLLGQTLNLFHLLGAFLGVCLSHNYAIFSAENARRREARPPSVRLSAITTAASFGVLALSQIPVVAALGVTVAMIVVTALVIVELEPLTHGAAPVPHCPSNLP
jgi:predicted exporter